MAAQDLTWQLLPCRWKSSRTRAFVKRVESAALAARRGDAAFTGVSAFNRNHPSLIRVLPFVAATQIAKKRLSRRH
jgi:hypothetical protein